MNLRFDGGMYMDFYKNMCIKQGYVPSTCTMEGQMCFLLVQKQGDPCKGCNADREKCKGRSRE